MEQTIDDLFSDVADEASDRHVEVIIAVLDALDAGHDDLRRKILSSMPPTCEAMRVRRRLNRAYRYLTNLRDSRDTEADSSGDCGFYDPWPGLQRRIRSTQAYIESYKARQGTLAPCNECHSCKANGGVTTESCVWTGNRFMYKRKDDPFHTYLKNELPTVVADTAKSIKEELFNLI